MQITEPVQKFILHWGEMGTRWGVNRSVAQIHGLLYLAPHPLPADEIAELLSLARSNVSTSLKELQSWGLVNVVHIPGDRRDHFEALKDVHETFNRIVEERKRREIDPLLTILRSCLIEAEEDKKTPQEVRTRIATMLSFVETLTGWYEQVRKLPNATLMKLIRMGGKIAQVLGK